MKQVTNRPLSSTSRRNFIRGFGAMVGSVAASSLLSGNAFAFAMAYQPQSDSELSNGKIFNQSQLQLLRRICSIVIPKTDTLGAAEVDTHGFIDDQLYHCHDQQQQDKMVNLLTLVEQSSTAAFALPFVKLNAEQAFDLLTRLDLGNAPFDKNQRADFKGLKQLICFGYYTSEVGASQELRYMAIPGGFKGSIPYKEPQSAWGSLGLGY